ncbi:MAG: hypothetical protein KAI45_10935, partial [Melioribacteraceae bacterium]|nr:hypothetical protein [Melioribacteraceae bacterium]
MKKINKNEFDEIELLEKQLSQKLGVYKDFKNSENNERYFNNLHYKAIIKMEEKSSKAIFSFNPAISYAMLFIISFAVSYQLIDFSDEVSLINESYLFSETTLWLEEEDYLSSILDEDFDLDYASYINSELNYSSILTLSDEMNQLS